MLHTLKNNKRLNEVLFLGVLTLLCFGFSLFRLSFTGTKVFLFLNWNLFLAFIPWAMTGLAVMKMKTRIRKFVLFALLFIWLLFFPNAPYILTDLFHLRLNSSMPIWFDLVLILSFAWTGLLFGFLSLMDIENLLLQSLNKFWTRIIISILLFIGSFGIYVGRYLRWNSWDIITEPFNLFYDISDRIVNPFEHPRTWGLTLFMGLFLNMIYWSFKIIKDKVKS
jgi:uncharacterized membrane protein